MENFCRQKYFFPAKTIFASPVFTMKKTGFSTDWQKLANPGRWLLSVVHVSMPWCLQTVPVSDVRKKCHVAPTLSVDFVGYYLGMYLLL